MLQDHRPEGGADRDRHHHADRHRDQHADQDQRAGDQLDDHGHVEHPAVLEGRHQLDGQRRVAHRLGIEVEEEVVGAVDQHPGAEHDAPHQDEVFHGQAPAGWAAAGASGAPRVRGLERRANIAR